jgi:hypothetical protein
MHLSKLLKVMCYLVECQQYNMCDKKEIFITFLVQRKICCKSGSYLDAMEPLFYEVINERLTPNTCFM